MLIDRDSANGQILLREAMAAGAASAGIAHSSVKQIHKKVCGVATTCVLLSSRGCIFTEESLWEEMGIPTSVTDKTSVQANGMTLDTFSRFVIACGLTGARKVFSKDSSPEAFREMASTALSSGGLVAVNYHMETLGQGSGLGGHLSPLAAYHAATDSFLVLDVWPETNACWASTDTLYKSMATFDSTSNSSRGWLVIPSQA